MSVMSCRKIETSDLPRTIAKGNNFFSSISRKEKSTISKDTLKRIRSFLLQIRIAGGEV